MGKDNQQATYLATKEALENYCGIHQSTEIRTLVVEHQEPQFTEPADPGKDITPAQLEKYKMELKEVKEDHKKYKQDKAKMYWIILGQCTKPLQAKLKAEPTYPTIESNLDVIGLLKMLKEVIYSTTKAIHPSVTMHYQLVRFINCNQSKGEAPDDFMKRFLEQTAATEAVWGKLIPHNMKGKPTADQDAARDQFLATSFLHSLTQGKSGDYRKALNNDFVNGKDHYPKDIPSVLTALSNWRGSPPQQQQQRQDKSRPPTPHPRDNESSFSQQTVQVSEDEADNKRSGWASKTSKKKVLKNYGGFQVVQYDHT
jgi:hypothetical protein